MCDLHDGSEFTGRIFPKYTSHAAFNTIVNLLLQSTICVNCSRPTPLSRKRRAAYLLSTFSSGTESLCLAGQTTSSGFIPVNFVSRPSGTASLSPSMRRTKDGDKRKTAVKEAARDGNYEPPVSVFFHSSHCF